MTKFCTDCRFFKNDEPCQAPQNLDKKFMKGFELVNNGGAAPKYVWMNYATAREGGWFEAFTSSKCGNPGRWFKPK